MFLNEAGSGGSVNMTVDVRTSGERAAPFFLQKKINIRQ